ncbi:sensor histidine kinase [Sulfurimonas sp. CVO]|uniref:sensor histidine kinase n=1 Tax=Sulfurimonas sp. CVO TaxID=2283483 RepID=UPI00132EE27F|nr:HAMP domain-containing sensor histidine kinase [Sulfurimonas sp. CVO]QHG92016.1 sensor histidine kinase [Sulfurimonas sp. CVO]
MIVVVDESVIYKPIKEFKAQAQNIGYVVIALMVFFYIMFFIFLMRKSKIVAKHISKPINELSELTDNLGIRPNTLLKDTSNIAEIAKLAENFNMLSSELENRTNAYIESQMREKLKEKEACAAYKEGLIESTGGYLHNVGNSLAVLDAKLLMLQSVVTSLQKSELGFKRAIEMMQNSQAKSEEKNALILFLEEFNDILSEETTAQIVDISNGIQRVKNHATEMIRHQQDRFANREIKESYIYSFSLNEMLENIIEDYRLECLRNGISVEFAGDGDIVLRSMKYRLQSGVANVLKNAIESILLFKQRGEGKINITLKKEDKKAVIQIKDNGAGVDEENIEKIFSFGYTTKKGGNGFGLHALNNFLNSIGGSITMKNNDHEDGVTVNMEILIDEKI